MSISLWPKYQLTLFSLVKPNMVISYTETRGVKDIILQAWRSCVVQQCHNARLASMSIEGRQNTQHWDFMIQASLHSFPGAAGTQLPIIHPEHSSSCFVPHMTWSLSHNMVSLVTGVENVLIVTHILALYPCQIGKTINKQTICTNLTPINKACDLRQRYFLLKIPNRWNSMSPGSSRSWLVPSSTCHYTPTMRTLSFCCANQPQ